MQGPEILGLQGARAGNSNRAPIFSQRNSKSLLELIVVAAPLLLICYVSWTKQKRRLQPG